MYIYIIKRGVGVNVEASPESSSSILLQIILLIILTAINAFFASAEMAIVSLNKNKVKMLAEQGNKKALLLEKLFKEPTKFLSTIQVGITLASFFASASAATGISVQFGKALEKVNVPYGSQIALVIVTIILSYVTLVFGELYPKRVALQQSEVIAMFAVKPILFLSKIASPFIKVLTLSTALLLKMTGIKVGDIEEKVSEEEIRSLVEAGQEDGVFNETEKEMINSIFEFDDKIAREVMTPRIDVYSVDINDSLNDYLDELLQMKYSRIPVYEEDRDNIIGILYIKDFIIEARKHGFENVNIKDILHEPYFVPESKKIDELFKELQQSKRHIAVLIDEYGGFSGIATIEDLIEEVMGNIEDEYDDDEPQIEKVDEGTFIIDGQVPIDDINDQLALNLNSESHETISGLLIDIIGEIPDEDEKRTIEIDNNIFKIQQVREKRIDKIKLYIQSNEVS